MIHTDKNDRLSNLEKMSRIQKDNSSTGSRYGKLQIIHYEVTGGPNWRMVSVDRMTCSRKELTPTLRLLASCAVK